MGLQEKRLKGSGMMVCLACLSSSRDVVYIKKKKSDLMNKESGG